MRQEWIKSEGAADQMNHAAQCYANKFHSERQLMALSGHGNPNN